MNDNPVPSSHATLTTHAGLVAIVGRPNVGKSTLLNKLVGQKVSITSKKPQTTRHRILGIDTVDNYQTVYVDTPGLHIEEKRAINRLMNKAASSSISDVELVLFVVEGTRWNDDDQMVLNKLIASGKPVVLVVNKVDLYKDKSELLPHLQWLGSQLNFADVVPLSAESGDNVAALKKVVQRYLPPCEFFFPDDYITDRSQRFMAAEIVREKLMRFLGDELPYSVTVEIERFKWEEKHFHIAALVLVERESQKRMVIGNKGERIKTIATEARLDMAAMLEQPVFLQVWVKVKSGWADDERALRSLGYGED
ncbi:GTPase Era [Arsukibacterium indicum]|uniref:GTPase Era n=1 Tax=Arsukibacterium indicum TaxID=2848612 RepID=A0ABS6MQM2_9GAMM|nr:GTPase Era [Arsukibacterium indicum]MBV2130646.1 GTPase Era [Arsukibacterium indicum]